MKKLLFLLFFLSINAYAAIEHDNDVCVTGGGWDSVSFSTITKQDTDKYKVTNNQPFSGINQKKQPSNKNCIRVRFGRKNSTAVMTWANDLNRSILGLCTACQIPNPVPAKCNNTGACYVFPAQANAAFIGTMIFKKKDISIECSNVIIAQTGNYPGVSGNIWLIYDNHDSGLYCTNQNNGEAVDLQVRPGTIIQGHSGIRPLQEDENPDGGMSAAAGSNSDNTFDIKIR